MTMDSTKLKNAINTARCEAMQKYSGQKLNSVLEGLGFVDDLIDSMIQQRSIAIDKFLDTWE